MVNGKRVVTLIGAALLSLALVGMGRAADAQTRATAPLPGGIDMRVPCDTKPNEPACLRARLRNDSPLQTHLHGPGSIVPRECAQVCSAGAALAKDCDRCRSRAQR